MFLVIALGVFLVRGPGRAVARGEDFSVYYCSARAWVFGSDPYSTQNLQLIARRSGDAPSDFLHNAVSPPPTFVILSPLALLPWTAAKYTWLGLNLFLIIVMLVQIYRMNAPRLGGAGRMLLIAFFLALSPLHTGFSHGQLALAVTACIVCALWMETQDRPWLAGLLLGLAVVLKPQIGVLFILYAICRWRWRTATAAVLLAGLISAIGVIRLEAVGVDWLTSLQSNYESFTNGGDGDIASTTHVAHQMVNLQYPLYMLLGSKVLANSIALMLCGLGFVLTVLAAWRAKFRNGRLLAYGAVSVLSLLMVYHRFYDAVLLVIPLAWAFGELSAGRRGRAIVALGLIAVYLLPGASLLFVLADRGWIPATMAETWFWRCIVLPHHVYALVGLGCVMLVSLFRKATQQAA